MTRLERWAAVRWRVPAIAGALIVTSFCVTALAGLGQSGVAPDGVTASGHTRTGADIVADALMIAAAVVAGASIALRAWRGLLARAIGIDLLVSIAALGAVVIGEFWEAAAVTTLFTVGSALEAATLNRTRSALAALVKVAPARAIVVRGGEQVEVAATAVAMGETVLVTHGAKVPVDGEVVAGGGSVDEAAITGESLPVEKSPGDRVYAGTISHGGMLQVRATGVGADTTLARIIHRVEEAQDAKSKTQRFMDRFSAWYTPAIIVIAVVMGAATSRVDLALTLLVVSCPGALVISIPVSIVAGVGRAARDGVLIKGGEYLEATARIDALAVDKTGTLTSGRPVVTDVLVLADHLTERDVLGWAARAEVGSQHPLARPVIEAAAAAGMAPLPGAALPEVTETIPGRGVMAISHGHTILVGNRALLCMFWSKRVAGECPAALDDAQSAAAQLARVGSTPMLVAVDGDVIGVIAVADAVRADSPSFVAAMRSAGVQRIVMLTGDVGAVAESVAARAGIEDVRSGLLPEDKLAAVRELRDQGHTVAMLGDGVNDAPALAAADVGVALGAIGSAVAIETADIALLHDDLMKLPHAIAIARKTVGVMRQNIAIALVTVGLLLAGVLAGGVTMAAGMLAHEASVLVVVVNAMRLLRPVTRKAAAPPSSRPSVSRRRVAPGTPA
ncbi:MAG TPA: cation-translocating P-type ATPase [Trueperaceae bacterium]|nr:cation-translocating P-type ATPase [Trueperaceae bacterium]